MVTGATPDASAKPDKHSNGHLIIICEPRQDCVDPNTLRWHCMRGHDGAADGVCPLDHCDREGANR